MTGITTRARRGALAVALALVAPIGVVAATAAPSSAALPACTKTWTNTSGGSWDTAASWSGGTVPTATDHVCLTTAGTYTVTLADTEAEAPVTVASLRVGGTGSGTGTQTLVVSRGLAIEGSSLLATQGIEVQARGALELGESDRAQVSIGVGDGAIIANGGRISQVTGQEDVHEIHGDVVNSSHFRLDQAIFVEGTFTNDGDALLEVNHVLHVEDTMWTKSGSISGEWAVVAYDGLRVGDAVIGSPAMRPVFSVEGGELSFESDRAIEISVVGDVTVTGDPADDQDISIQTEDGQDTTLTFTGTWTNWGYLSLEPGADADVSLVGSGPGATFVNRALVDRYGPEGAGATIAADVVNRGEIDTSDGVLDVTGTLRSSGVLDLRFGEITVGHDLILGPTSVTALRLTAADGTDVGRINADGASAVDGVMEVDTSVAPAVGDSFTVITTSSRGGTFDDVRFLGPASYQIEHAATAVRLHRRASETTHQRFVRAAFQDFIGRQPDPKELSNHATRLDIGQQTRATLVRGLAGSEAYVTTLVQRFYADTLGRPGDAGGVAYWVDELRSGRKTVAQVAGSFYASPEYFVRAGNTNAAWITDLYDVFFERAPSGGDLSYWTGRVAGQGRTRVAVELYQSLESRRQRVDRLYQDLLGRPGDEDGVDYWAGRLTREGDLVLAVFLASSPEYLERAEERYP
jgi:hypothetical protein